MLRQFKLQDRLVALAAVPIMTTAVVAAGLLLFVSGSVAYGIFALAGVVVSIVVAMGVIKSVNQELTDLRDATAELADGHRRLADGEIDADELPTLSVEPEGPMADLASSINAITASTVEADQNRQSAVKAGLSTIVVNLARRSQTLLDRQVEYLDTLESSEEDPDRLAELFKVDHLATRMRRNAESLKVLAEADPGMRRGSPVDITDVLRVAMGEVETYENIELQSVEPGMVESGTAMDVAHLVAELMENATQFSPPDSVVSVTGSYEADNFHVIIDDRGMGLDAQRLTDANQTLANPPELGLGMGRSLGFIVIGRLAERLGATVTLSANGGGGTRALVKIPKSLFQSDGASAAPAAEAPAIDSTVDSDQEESGGGSAALERLLGISPDALESEEGAPTDWATEAPAAGGSLTSSRKRKSKSSDEPSADSNDTAAEETPLAAPIPESTASTESASEETWSPPPVTPDAPPRVVDPVGKLDDAIPSGDAFEAGVNGLLDDSEGAALTKRQRGTSNGPTPMGGRPVTTTTSRDPSEVRSMLSRYRDGLKDGKKQRPVSEGEKASDDSGSTTNSKDR